MEIEQKAFRVRIFPSPVIATESMYPNFRGINPRLRITPVTKFITERNGSLYHSVFTFRVRRE